MKISQKTQDEIIEKICSSLKSREYLLLKGVSCTIRKHKRTYHSNSKYHTYVLKVDFSFSKHVRDSYKNIYFPKHVRDSYYNSYVIRTYIYDILSKYNPFYEKVFIINIFYSLPKRIKFTIKIPDPVPILKINDHLTVVLGPEESTDIFIDNQRFTQCKYLLFNLDANNLEEYDEIGSIDEMKEKYSNDNEQDKTTIDPETEFWGHCSNLQAWYEHDYDTRLLEMRLAFPLLKRLTEVGDLKAKKVLKEEIARRYQSGFQAVQIYLRLEGYLDLLTPEEKEAIGIKPITLGRYRKELLKIFSEYYVNQLAKKVQDVSTDIEITGDNRRDIIFACLPPSSIKELGCDPWEILGKFRRKILLYFDTFHHNEILKTLYLRRARGEYKEENILKYLIEGNLLTWVNHKAQKGLFGARLSILGKYADEIFEKFSPKKVYNLIEYLEHLHQKKDSKQFDLFISILDGLDLHICGNMQMEKQYCSHYQEFCGCKGVCMCPNAKSHRCTYQCLEKIWNDYAQCMIDLEYFRKTTGKRWPDPRKDKEYIIKNDPREWVREALREKRMKFKTLDNWLEVSD